MARILPYVFVTLLLLGNSISFAQCPAAVPPMAGPVITTESRCQSSGTATISVSGGAAPFVYRIISGPVTTSPQSSNIFLSLPPGSYTVKITDNCNTQVNVGFTITGSYSVPAPVTTLTPPTCPGGNNGSIGVNVTNGRPPFTYALISPSPVTMPDQPGNIFTGLSAGTYTYRVTDSCGNFQTRNVVLADGSNGAFIIQSVDLHYEGCDSFSVPATLYPVVTANYRPPYTVQLSLPDGTIISHVLTAAAIDSVLGVVTDTFYFHYNHIPGSVIPIVLNAVNSCGATSSYQVRTAKLNLETYVKPLPDCSGQYSYTFDPGRDNNYAYGVPLILHCATITYKIISAAGVLLGTQTNNSTFVGLPPGNYKIVRQDCCRKDSLLFTWATVSPLKITNYHLYRDMTCKEGTVDLTLHVDPNVSGSVIVASGPPSVSFANGAVHNYVYPDTLKNLVFGALDINIDYFNAGTYKVYAMDSCGHKDSITVTVTPSDLRHSVFSAALVKGCTDANKILLNAESNGNVIGVSDAYVNVDPGDLYYDPGISPFSDSVTNLSPDTYNVTYNYTLRAAVTAYLQGMNGYGCDVIGQSIVVPPYQQPLFSKATAIASCGLLRNVALLADSSVGVAPYEYQISAGPASTALQASPVFQNLAVGTYPFLMSDACGNSYTSSIAVDTLTVPATIATGNLCANSVATLSLPASPYLSYQWLVPGGSTVTGNSISLNPVTAADTGTYQITATSSIAGCTDSRQSSFKLQYCSLLLLGISHWQFMGEKQGENMILMWQINKEDAIGYFVVERSANGLHFDALEHVLHAGNAYRVTDHHPLAGVSWYRLKIVYTSGLVTYSPVIACLSATVRKPLVYPSLITPGVALQVVYPPSTQTTFVQLMSIDGKLCFTKTAAPASSHTSIDMSSLQPGHYLVVVIYNGKKSVVQVLKE